MDYKAKFNLWCEQCKQNEKILAELNSMDEKMIKDAFYCDLSFGTGGLRGIIGAGTNRMNIYTVAKATQGLSYYLINLYGKEASVSIGYDSRINSYLFAQTTASVFSANGIHVYMWPTLTPVPTVSFATRYLNTSAGIMITASHNPSKYNGYKVYDNDGCQITNKTATNITNIINTIDPFNDVQIIDFDLAISKGMIEYISDDVMNSFISAVKLQSVLFGDEINRDVSIVYSPLNGTGFVPVTRVLNEAGFKNIHLVQEQCLPDGNFPTCPYPNPEIKEALSLGLSYCKHYNAELLLATDPDCDRIGIAVKDRNEEYVLLSGNE